MVNSKMILSAIAKEFNENSDAIGYYRATGEGTSEACKACQISVNTLSDVLYSLPVKVNKELTESTKLGVTYKWWKLIV